MKAICWSIIASLIFGAFATQAIDIIIKTDGKDEKKDEQKEEKKDDKKGGESELPEDAVLRINAFNQTNYDFALHVLAFAKDQENQGINVQNISPKSSPPTTIGALFGKAGTVFRYDEKGTKLIATSPFQFPIECEPMKKEEEPVDKATSGPEPEKKEESKDEKKDVKTDEKKEEKPIEYLATKSIDFIFYLPKGALFPKCFVGFDILTPDE